MLIAGINKQFLVHLATQAILWQHTFYSPFDDCIRTTAEKVLGDLFLFATGITREIDVDLVIHFVTGEYNLVGVDHYDEITAVYVRCIIDFVLAPEDGGNFGTHTTYGLISTVHNVPVAFNGSLVRMFGGEM